MPPEVGAHGPVRARRRYPIMHIMTMRRAAGSPALPVSGTAPCATLPRMFFIITSSPSFDDLGVVELACRACGQRGPNHVQRRRNRVLLFFVLPIATFGTRYLTSCARCGARDEYGKAEARAAGIAA